MTDKGKDYVQKTVVRLYEAKEQALDAWPEEEVNTYIPLMEKYADCLRQQIDKL